MTLNACAADWREDVLGDAVAHLRRRHRELDDRDIDALVTAIRARVKAWELRPLGNDRLMPMREVPFVIDDDPEDHVAFDPEKLAVLAESCDRLLSDGRQQFPHIRKERKLSGYV